jgi:ABC-type antimicrobial peptide transport system permease subunit
MSRNQSDTQSLLERLLGTVLGGVCGVVSYFGLLLMDISFARHTNPWSLVGPFKWFVLIGALLGAIGGLSFAQFMWQNTVEDLHWDVTTLGIIVLVLLAITVVVYFALQI